MSKEPRRYYKTIIDTEPDGSQHGRSVEVTKEEYDKEHKIDRSITGKLKTLEKFFFKAGLKITFGTILVILGIATFPLGIILILIGIVVYASGFDTD